MKPKQILTIVLTLFVVGSLAYMIGKEQKTDSKPSEETNEPVPAQKQNEAENTSGVSTQNNQNFLMKPVDNNSKRKIQLIVYYFHGDVRCPTCHKLETYAKEALDTYFPDELASQDIVWRAINVDNPENRHFIQDYKLVTKSVVLSEITDGKEIEWKHLDQIWQKVRDKTSYLNYIRDSITEFIAEEKS